MTDDRMPAPGGNPVINNIAYHAAGIGVALFLLGSRAALAATQAVHDWRLERAEAKDARRERARAAWDELGCLPEDECQ